MTGYNMPPGVNERDIPGNRKIDILWERKAEKYCENCLEEVCEKDIMECSHSHDFEKYFERILNLY